MSTAMKKSAAKKEASHPPMWEMVKSTFADHSARTGMSRQALRKNITVKFKSVPAAYLRSSLNRCIKKAVSKGELTQKKGSFKLAVNVAKAAGKGKAKAEKKVVKKRTTAPAAAVKKIPSSKAKKTMGAKKSKVPVKKTIRKAK